MERCFTAPPRGKLCPWRTPHQNGWIATGEQKLSPFALPLHCSAAGGSVSSVEHNEVRQISRELKLRHQDYIAVSLRYKEYLEVFEDLRAGADPKKD
jgi:hypothetical protein